MEQVGQLTKLTLLGLESIFTGAISGGISLFVFENSLWKNII